MIDKFLSALSFLSYRVDDDSIDRLHYFWSTNILIALSILVSWKQFGGRPIECMVPKMFSGAWEQYTENYCWSQDTYYVSFDEEVPVDLDQRREKKISYYQWVPFFLLFQALCFRLPSLLWKYMAGQSGIKIHDIVSMATDRENVKPDTKAANLKGLTTHLQNALRFHRRLMKRHVTPHRIIRFLNLPYRAFFVTLLYMITKLLYLGNVVFQLYLLNRFLETDKYSFYGIGALRDIINGAEWEASGAFPRVTLCDFRVRVMGNNVQRYSVQCVLVINIFNEKIFVFLWFWYALLMGLTVLSLLYWLIVMSFSTLSKRYISKHLELSDCDNTFDSHEKAKDVERFVSKYLKKDGIFVLRMITMHAGVIFGTDLIAELWRAFFNIEETNKQNNPGYLTPSPVEESGGFGREKLGSFLRLRKPGGKKQKQKDAEMEDQKQLLKQVLLPDGKIAYVMHQDSPKSQPDDEKKKAKKSKKDKDEKPPPPPATAPPTIPPKPNKDAIINFSDAETLPATARGTANAANVKTDDKQKGVNATNEYYSSSDSGD